MSIRHRIKASRISNAGQVCNCVERVYVQAAIADGAINACGGQPSRRFEKGFFYEPTVLVNCRQDMEIVREEIFGPAMPIMTFKSVDEALVLANDCK